MKDFDRFTEFLLREAAGYNEPPEPPVRAMWPRIEVRFGLAATESRERPAAVLPVSVAGRSVDPSAYNEPPGTPREEMWTRIESAWALRRAASASRTRPAWPGRGGAAGWIAALAAAALVVGIGLGRGTRPSPPGKTTIGIRNPVTASGPDAQPATVDHRTPVGAAGREGADPVVEAPAGARVANRADTRSRGEPATSELEAAANSELLAVETPAERSKLPADWTEAEQRILPGRHGGGSTEPEFDHATARHMDRAATLLTAFRTDRRTPTSRQDLARWARELLAETRMFIGLSEFASPAEQDLLQDLELVLIQIAGLVPGAPDFEWELARESMERQGTLMRLRAASTESDT